MASPGVRAATCGCSWPESIRSWPVIPADRGREGLAARIGPARGQIAGFLPAAEVMSTRRREKDKPRARQEETGRIRVGLTGRLPQELDHDLMTGRRMSWSTTTEHFLLDLGCS